MLETRDPDWLGSPNHPQDAAGGCAVAWASERSRRKSSDRGHCVLYGVEWGMVQFLLNSLTEIVES